MRKVLILVLLNCLVFFQVECIAKGGQTHEREYWCETAYKISFPVLDALSKQQLKATMPVELRTGMAKNKPEPTYLEALGRTLCGIAPWLELSAESTKEGKMQSELLQLSHKAIHNIVDPESLDYVDFSRGHQPLVDAAFLAQAFIRSPKKLWGGLDEDTKELVLSSLYSTRVIKPNYSNWLLFSATIEAFLLSIDEPWDAMRIDYAIKKHSEWYKGDGIYGDGPNFHWDYYNSFVIQPMLVDIYQVMYSKKKCSEASLKSVVSRSTRYAEILERLISPEGTFPPVGRSICYRVGALQTLGQMSLIHKLPANVPPAQVRCAMTAVIKRFFESEKTFDNNGWLTLGFAGHQPGLAESYITTGSLYLTTTGFLPLGLPSSDPFWSAPYESWTAVKAWNGEAIPIDHAH